MIRDAQPFDASGDRGWSWLAALALLPVVASALSQRLLAHDGAYFLQRILDEGRFFLPTDTRIPADVVQEAPALLLRLFGSVSLPTLVLVWNLTLPFVLALSMASSWRALDTGRRSAMVLPILSVALVTLSNDGHFQHEGHLLVAATWPVLFTLLRAGDWQPRDRMRLILWGVLLSGSHEAGLPVLVLAILLAYLRIWRTKSVADRVWTWGFVVVATLFLAAMVYGIVHPNSTTNRDGFRQDLRKPFLHLLAWLVLTAGATVMFAWGAGSQRWSKMIALGWSLATLAWALGFLPPPSTGSTMPLRTLFLTVLGPLSWLGVAAMLWGRRIPRGVHLVSTSVIVAFGTLSLLRLASWNDYRAQFRAVLSSREGYVDVEDTPLIQYTEADSWNLPLLSRYWDATDRDAVVLNPKYINWQPFDPRRTRVLTEFHR